MIYGTAPYMAGKGSPAQYIDTSDNSDHKVHPALTKFWRKHTKDIFIHSRMLNVNCLLKREHMNQ